MSELEPLVQWCEVGHHSAQETEQARFEGEFLMTCTSCRKSFPNQVQLQWGPNPYQKFWDLGKCPIPKKGKVRGRPYSVRLTVDQARMFRAAGYLISKESSDGYVKSGGTDAE